MATEHQRFQDNIIAGVRDILQVESPSRHIEIDSIGISQPKDPNDLQKLKAVRINQGTYADKVYADLRVVDNRTNQTVNKGRVHVVDIPIRTPLNTYLIDGTHYQAKNQSQLKGTAYTRVTSAGEIESDFRLERGRNFKIMLDPENEQFVVRVGSSNMPLYPLLKAMGAQDDQIQNSWGGEILTRNKTSETTSQKTIAKFARKVFGDQRAADKTPEELQEMVRNHFIVESHLNPEASRLTLGEAYKNVTPGAVLASTSRILALHRGTGKPDSRDEIYYKRFRDLPETGKEYLAEHAETLQRRLARRIEKDSILTGDLRNNLGPGDLNPTIKAIFTRTRLQSAGETTNILDLLSADSKVTVTGEHGISGEHKVMPSTRDVRASGLGFIDPVKTPAGGAGITEHLAINTQVKGGRISTSMVNVRTNRRIRLTPEDLFGKTVAFPEELELRGGKWRTDSKMVQVVKDGDILSVKPEEVDYIVPTAAEMYSEVTNLVPFLSANSGGRAILGTAQMVQAVSLINREAPLVSANNFEASDAFKMGQISPVSGTVISVGKDRIKIKSRGSGSVAQAHVINNPPLNRGAFINSEPLVKRGDRVSRGQLLADTNYGKGGKLALAVNLITAVMPYKGETHH